MDEKELKDLICKLSSEITENKLYKHNSSCRIYNILYNRLYNDILNDVLKCLMKLPIYRHLTDAEYLRLKRIVNTRPFLFKVYDRIVALYKKL